MKTTLTNELRTRLIELALEARKSAYAPYSNYQVGAALLTTSGQVLHRLQRGKCRLSHRHCAPSGWRSSRPCRKGSVSSRPWRWSPATAARPAAPAAR